MFFPSSSPFGVLAGSQLCLQISIIQILCNGSVFLFRAMTHLVLLKLPKVSDLHGYRNLSFIENIDVKLRSFCLINNKKLVESSKFCLLFILTNWFLSEFAVLAPMCILVDKYNGFRLFLWNACIIFISSSLIYFIKDAGDAVICFGSFLYQ